MGTRNPAGTAYSAAAASRSAPAAVQVDDLRVGVVVRQFLSEDVGEGLLFALQVVAEAVEDHVEGAGQVPRRSQAAAGQLRLAAFPAGVGQLVDVRFVALAGARHQVPAVEGPA